MTRKTKAPAYDQTIAEDSVVAAIQKRIGSRPDLFDSSNEGVVAIGRLGFESKKVDWQEFAAELARTTNIGVLCVCDCDWQFDDRPDEEATFISFDVPSVTGTYRENEYRNKITPVTPENAPAQTDFDRLKQAKLIIDGRVKELQGAAEKLDGAGKSHEAAEPLKEIGAMDKLKHLAAEDREAVAAVLDLDFKKALEIADRDLEPTAPAP